MTDWQRIVSRHRRSLQATAWRLLGNHADVADCLQDTFLTALEISRRKRVRNWGRLLHWLVVRRALDRLRRRLREAGRHDRLADWQTVVSSNPGPDRQAETAELAASLRRALAGLPPLHAQVFCLRYVSGMSYRAIGRALGMKTNTVGTTLHRARRRLRCLLGAGEDD